MEENRNNINRELFALLSKHKVGYSTGKRIYGLMKGREAELVDWLLANPSATVNDICSIAYSFAGTTDPYSDEPGKRFLRLTHLIPQLEEMSSAGHWVFPQGVQAPYVKYEKLTVDVLDAVDEIINRNPLYSDVTDGYVDILRSNGLDWKEASMRDAAASVLDARCILALLVGAYCAERFSDGTVGHFFHKGCILRWVRRLAELDAADRVEESTSGIV